MSQAPPPGMPPPPPPPGPQDPYGAGPYGTNPYGQAPQDGMGTAAMVLGIVGLVMLFCYGFGIVASVLAVIFGKLGMDKAARGEASNAGVAKAGFIMGLVGVGLFVALVIVVGIIWLIAVASSGY